MGILSVETRHYCMHLQIPCVLRRTPYAPGQFEDHAGNIQDQYRKLSKVLPALRDEAEARANGLATTLNTVKAQVQPMLAKLQARKLAKASEQSAGGQPEGVSVAAGTGAGKRGAPKVSATAAAAAAAPAAALQRHLGRK